MTDSRPAPARQEAADDTTSSHRTEAYPGTPRWVKVAGIVAAVALLLVVLMHLTGLAPSAHVAPVEHGVQQP